MYSVLVKKLRASLLMTREDAGLRGAEEEEGEERGQDVMQRPCRTGNWLDVVLVTSSPVNEASPCPPAAAAYITTASEKKRVFKDRRQRYSYFH